MATSTIDLRDIAPEILEKLDEKARQMGWDRATYIRYLIEKDVGVPSLRAIFAPVREEMIAKGISEEEFGTLVEEARQERLQEQQCRPSESPG